MLIQSFNLVLLKTFALQFFEYTVLILVFFFIFVAVNHVLDRAKKLKNIGVKASTIKSISH